MGPPFSLVIANFCMESFEQQAISLVLLQIHRWHVYNLDTRKEELQGFLHHLSSIHANIKFTMEAEQNKMLSFLDVLVSRRPDSLLGHAVYWKHAVLIHSSNGPRPYALRIAWTWSLNWIELHGL
jgi:hypothetical protein